MGHYVILSKTLSKFPSKSLLKLNLIDPQVSLTTATSLPTGLECIWDWELLSYLNVNTQARCSSIRAHVASTGSAWPTAPSRSRTAAPTFTCLMLRPVYPKTLLWSILCAIPRICALNQCRINKQAECRHLSSRTQILKHSTVEIQ